MISGELRAVSLGSICVPKFADQKAGEPGFVPFARESSREEGGAMVRESVDGESGKPVEAEVEGSDHRLCDPCAIWILRNGKL